MIKFIESQIGEDGWCQVQRTVEEVKMNQYADNPFFERGSKLCKRVLTTSTFYSTQSTVKIRDLKYLI